MRTTLSYLTQDDPPTTPSTDDTSTTPTVDPDTSTLPNPDDVPKKKAGS